MGDCSWATGNGNESCDLVAGLERERDAARQERDALQCDLITASETIAELEAVAEKAKRDLYDAINACNDAADRASEWMGQAIGWQQTAKLATTAAEASQEVNRLIVKRLEKVEAWARRSYVLATVAEPCGEYCDCNLCKLKADYPELGIERD